MATAKKPGATKAKALPFNKTLVLNQWILGLFGVGSMDELSGHLKDDSREGLDDNNVSRMHNALAFGQAVKGSKSEGGNESLSDQYAKSVLVDYSYRYFYGDGFGKD